MKKFLTILNSFIEKTLPIIYVVLAIEVFVITASATYGQFFNTRMKPSLGHQVNPYHPLGTKGGLVAAWFLNEGSGNKVFDLSGNGNTGTLQADTSWVPGKFGSTLEFDGTGDYVSLGKTWADFIGADESTFVAWVKPTGTAFVDVNPYSGQSILGEAPATYIAFCRTDHTDDKDAIWAMMYDGGIKQVGVAYTNNAWNCVVMVHGSGVLSIYNNGIFGDSVACGSVADLTDTVRIGWGSKYWLGQIDHILIYNRALSASEVAELYREPFIMFKNPNELALMGSAEAPPAPTGQVIIIQ